MAVDICLLEFFNAFKAKNNEKFQKAKMQIIPPTQPPIHRPSQSFDPFGQRLSIPAADQKDRSSGNENAQPPSLRYTLITLLNVPTLSIWGADQKDRTSQDFVYTWGFKTIRISLKVRSKKRIPPVSWKQNGKGLGL